MMKTLGNIFIAVGIIMTYGAAGGSDQDPGTPFVTSATIAIGGLTLCAVGTLLTKRRTLVRRW